MKIPIAGVGEEVDEFTTGVILLTAVAPDIFGVRMVD